MKTLDIKRRGYTVRPKRDKRGRKADRRLAKKLIKADSVLRQPSRGSK